MNETKRQQLEFGRKLIQKGASKTSVLAILDSVYQITPDEFTLYDSTVVVDSTYAADQALDRIEQARDRMFAVADSLDKIEKSEKLKDIPYYSQTSEVSDAEIVRMFEERDRLMAEKEDILESVPTEAEWYKAGGQSDVRIKELKHAYLTKKAEEEALMKYPAGTAEGEWYDWIPKTLSGTLYTALGAMGQLGYGLEDLTGYHQDENVPWNALFTEGSPGEAAHEVGFFPYVIPGEMFESGVPGYEGTMGYTKEFGALESSLLEQYRIKEAYNKRLPDYNVENIEEQILGLNNLIRQHKLYDPRAGGQ